MDARVGLGLWGGFILGGRRLGHARSPGMRLRVAGGWLADGDSRGGGGVRWGVGGIGGEGGVGRISFLQQGWQGRRENVFYGFYRWGRPVLSILREFLLKRGVKDSGIYMRVVWWEGGRIGVKIGPGARVGAGLSPS